MLAPAPAPIQRDLLPDMLRAWALIGIVLVNVEMFSGSKMDGYPSSALATPFDSGLHILVAGLFTLKSYSLFSLMFGAGLGYQMVAALSQGVGETGRYYRRMAGLLFLGLLHAVFFFLGDILVIYAVLGSLLYLCRNGKAKTLIIWGLIAIVVQTLLTLTAALSLMITDSLNDPEVQRQWQDGLAASRKAAITIDAVFADGGFLEVARQRLIMYPGFFPAALAFQGVSAFGFILIGLGLHKTGILGRPNDAFWHRCRIVFLPIGLIFSFYGTWLYTEAPARMNSQALFGMAVMMAASPFSTFGYAGWLAKVCTFEHGSVLRFIARGGSATLSAYLLQSVILSFVFLEFGLGLYGQLSAGTVILIAFATGLFTLGFVSLWLSGFKRGPVEIVLRRWTYLRKETPSPRS